ncbi:hypothetical protein Salat_1513400 [Sesamum alatum]|uniref:Uncharacterized protein n=1 Tax=Sesamum alatum TaxID=300844 RepID=A0AAE2CMB9_9LAMI|nr:hypothetical protein Salat_1513400 [Sesamum alatum]
MAIRFSLFSPPLAAAASPRNSRLVMCATAGNHHISSVHLQIKSSDHHKTKVFEDRSAGIVCYKDENGEITCEGYDEGPRFHHQISRFTCNSRDVEIIDMLQRCWLHVGDENDLSSSAADKGVAEHKDFNCNGINNFC